MCVIVFRFIKQPKELIASEVYHFQHSCEQNGKTIGKEYCELHWRGEQWRGLTLGAP
jgi:hypothetical protein